MMLITARSDTTTKCLHNIKLVDKAALPNLVPRPLPRGGGGGGRGGPGGEASLCSKHD